MTDQPLNDTDHAVTIQHQETVYSGAIWDIQRDTFTIETTDDLMTRDYLEHPGAVAIVALDDKQRVVMINQYRHPVRQSCWEIPAGLLDVPGETLLTTAKRELAEETDLTAKDWSVLIDHYPSAGSSTEAIRIYLAQDLQPVPADQRHNRLAEEAHLVVQRVPLQNAVDAVMTGAIKNVNAVAGILAYHLASTTHRTLRPADAPF